MAARPALVSCPAAFWVGHSLVVVVLPLLGCRLRMGWVVVQVVFQVRVMFAWAVFGIRSYSLSCHGTCITLHICMTVCTVYELRTININFQPIKSPHASNDQALYASRKYNVLRRQE